MIIITLVSFVLCIFLKTKQNRKGSHEGDDQQISPKHTGCRGSGYYRDRMQPAAAERELWVVELEGGGGLRRSGTVVEASGKSPGSIKWSWPPPPGAGGWWSGWELCGCEEGLSQRMEMDEQEMLCACVRVCVCMCMSAYVCMCMWVRVCMCVHVYMRVHTCI